MWDRKQIKERGMEAFRRNYWRAVLVSLILVIVGGSQGSNTISQVISSSSQVLVRMSSDRNDTSRLPSAKPVSSPSEDFDIFFDDGNGNTIDPFGEDGDMMDPFSNGGQQIPYMTPGEGYSGNDNQTGELFEDMFSDIFGNSDMKVVILVVCIILAILFAVIVISLVVSLALSVFIFSPLQVGIMKFFVQNLNSDGEVGTIGYAFDHHYLNQVKVMFFRWLYTFLWTLLFIIPGIVKSYEYRMMPYLLCEYPDMDVQTAFDISRQMMDGEKWKTFVFDLSFIGWFLLSAVTCGLAGIFFVNPYYNSSAAALYEALKITKGAPAPAVTPEQGLTY